MTLSHEDSGYVSNGPFSSAGLPGGESRPALLTRQCGGPQIGFESGQRRFERRAVGYVDREITHVRICREIFGQTGSRRDVEQRDSRTLSGQASRIGEAKLAQAPGDDNDFILERKERTHSVRSFPQGRRRGGTR